MEMARRIHLQQHGNLKGFGKTAKFYGDQWRPKFKTDLDKYGVNSYQEIFDNETIKALMKSVGM